MRWKQDEAATNEKKGVYCLDCHCNENAVYVGQTIRSISNRCQEHKKASERGNWQHSGISQHKETCDHVVDWENPKVLATMSGKNKKRLAYDLKVREGRKSNVTTADQTMDSMKISAPMLKPHSGIPSFIPWQWRSGLDGEGGPPSFWVLSDLLGQFLPLPLFPLSSSSSPSCMHSLTLLSFPFSPLKMNCMTNSKILAWFILALIHSISP